MVTTADARISVPTFPSTIILDSLIKVGIAKRLETDAWIHPYTFSSEQARPELLIALVAAGCVCFGIPKVNRTGLVLLEIARVALNKLIEDDNSAIRDLQYLQASMIWLDICGFCGYRRKMEIAESNLQPIATALRRCGKFDRVAYEVIVPSMEDDLETTTNKWRRWVNQESYKRLVFHVFEHDILMSMAKHRQPVISYAELTLPLPFSRELWLAPSAEAWRNAFLERVASGEKHDVCLRSLLANGRPASCLANSLDHGLASTAILYGNSAQVWEHIQQSTLRDNEIDEDPCHQLWMHSRHQSLYQKLKSIAESLQLAPPTAHLAHQFQMMSLHVSVDTVMRFGGKCGEAEAHLAYHKLQTWSVGKSARFAIWYVEPCSHCQPGKRAIHLHQSICVANPSKSLTSAPSRHASQLLRTAKDIPPYQIRGADAFITYHAIMVLWSYGMMLKNSARRTAMSTPVGGQSKRPPIKEGPLAQGIESNVFLDDLSSMQLSAYLHDGMGRPALRFPDGQCCEVRNVASIMALGCRVLEGNCPGETRDHLPQMIKSLCNLMDELGSLR